MKRNVVARKISTIKNSLNTENGLVLTGLMLKWW